MSDILNWLMTNVLEQLITMRLFLIEVPGELFIGVQYSLKLVNKGFSVSFSLEKIDLLFLYCA